MIQTRRLFPCVPDHRQNLDVEEPKIKFIFTNERIMITCNFNKIKLFTLTFKAVKTKIDHTRKKKCQTQLPDVEITLSADVPQLSSCVEVALLPQLHSTYD